MKSLFKFLVVVIAVFSFTTDCLAQNDREDEFEPIHKTIVPGDGYLKFEEKYDKNSSVMLTGDDLMFKSKKSQPAGAAFYLPLNPTQDYTLELTFAVPNLKSCKSIMVIQSDVFAMCIGYKSVDIAILPQDHVFVDTNWKMPKLDNKDEVICKIVRRKKILTFYVNNKYVCETTTNQISSSFPFGIQFINVKSGEMLLKSIRLDQGPETDEND